MATCLHLYRSSTCYYAFVRRPGKLICRNLGTDKLQVTKRKLRKFLGEQAHAASDAHKTYLDIPMKQSWREEPEPPPLKRDQQRTDYVCANWPGGTHEVLVKTDHRQCSNWLSLWSAQVAA